MMKKLMILNCLIVLSLPGLVYTIDKPVHIMFLFVDHWEPEFVQPLATDRANYWYNDYHIMASKHKDADGRMPQHTWFCRDLEPLGLRIISKAVFSGLGEMEVHIHHGTADDTNHDNTQQMSSLLDQHLSCLQKFGACIAAEPAPRTFFGFIHGMWCLDNSRLRGATLRQYCGVNREIDLLLSKKCYGDFTFPAWGAMEPTLKSKIFVSKDSDAPKSYDDLSLIRELSTSNGAPLDNELMILEGPGEFSTNVDYSHPPTFNSMTEWVSSDVHIIGRDNWIFVKVYTHSAESLTSPTGRLNLVGDVADKFYRDIEMVYNDGVNYKLHYVTSREAYNIVIAATMGKSGDPNDYRDYRIPQPANRHFFCDSPYSLIKFDLQKDKSAVLKILELNSPINIWSNDFNRSDYVFESSDLNGPYTTSDCETSQTATVSLMIKDLTPSNYYKFKINPVAHQTPIPTHSNPSILNSEGKK